MTMTFSRTIRFLTMDGSRCILLGILSMSILLGGWVAWYLLARITVYAVTQTARVEVATLRIGAVMREGDVLEVGLPSGALRVAASFPPSVALGRLHPGQLAHLRLTGFPWTQYGNLAATVTHVAHDGRDGQVRVELDLAPDMAFPIPLQPGMPGTLEVEVERVTPATLIVWSIGKRLGLARTAPQGEDCNGVAR